MPKKPKKSESVNINIILPGIDTLHSQYIVMTKNTSPLTKDMRNASFSVDLLMAKNSGTNARYANIHILKFGKLKESNMPEITASIYAIAFFIFRSTS